MTLNASFASPTRTTGRRTLEGSDRGLDVMIGLIVLITELMIGALALMALYSLGLEAVPGSTDPEAIQSGFLIAAVGSAVFVGITTISFLSRVIKGHRSWSAPLWGTVLMSAALVVGYITMAGGI